MLNLSLFAACCKARQGLARVRFSDVAFSAKDRLSALAVTPLIGDAPITVDWWLFGLIAGLAVVAGVSFGVIYRNLHGQLEEARARTTDVETELRTLLTVTDDAVLVLDGDGMIRAANPAAEELSGRSMDDLCGSEIISVIPQRFVLADVTRQGPASFQAYAIGAGSENTAVELVLAAVDLGQRHRYLALMRPSAANTNTTDLREAVARLCHNLNNQLTAVDGNLSMILIKGAIDEPTRGRVTDARRAMIKAQDVTRKLQVIAHGETEEADESSFQRSTIVPMPATLPPAPASPPTNARILVLDDEPAICTLVAGALESMGFSVVATVETADAIQACEDAFKAGRPFDLMISDLTLPGELDGSKVVSRLRTMDPHLKAIISSGYDQDPVMRHYRDHGFAGALFKPFDLGQLTRLVREVLDAGSPARKSA